MKSFQSFQLFLLLFYNFIDVYISGAQQLTLTSSSTQHRPRCLRSQISSGYIATLLYRHSVKSPLGHSARSLAAHFDELIYSAQATLPKESDQLRLRRHSAISPPGYIATPLNRHSVIAPGAQQLTLTSSSTQHRPRCLRSQISSGYIATRLHRHSAILPHGYIATRP